MAIEWEQILIFLQYFMLSRLYCTGRDINHMIWSTNQKSDQKYRAIRVGTDKVGIQEMLLFQDRMMNQGLQGGFFYFEQRIGQIAEKECHQLRKVDNVFPFVLFLIVWPGA